MRGSVTIVGIGPGNVELMTVAAQRVLSQATDVIGYSSYLARLAPLASDQVCHQSDNREELERARHALRLAESGRQVAVVSGGDPGVFAMAAAVFEAIERGDPAWRNLDVRVEPGVTAMLAAAAHAGAPLGGDFCAISLSDNLKSWTTIENRLEGAAKADFVIALYNPASHARPHQLTAALNFIRRLKDGATIVLLIRAAGSDETCMTTTTLAAVDVAQVDMRTLVIIGSSSTRTIDRNGAPWVYTPRSEWLPS